MRDTSYQRRNLDFVEIELLNKKRLLLENDWTKVRNLVEKTGYFIKSSSRFPFFSIEKRRYCSFMFRTTYDTIDSFFDPKYKVNCTLPQLAALFDVAFKEFDKTIVEHDISS